MSQQHRPERQDPTPVRADPTISDTRDRWIRFGDWLVRRGLISRADLFAALRRGDCCHCRLGDALVEAGLLPRSLIEAEARSFDAFHAGLKAKHRVDPDRAAALHALWAALAPSE